MRGHGLVFTSGAGLVGFQYNGDWVLLGGSGESLCEHGTIIELSQGLEKWFERYNDWRPHAALGNQTPTAVYQLTEPKQEQRKIDKAT